MSNINIHWLHSIQNVCVNIYDFRLCDLVSSLSFLGWIFEYNTMTSSDENIFHVSGLCAGIHRSPVNSPNKGQWRGAFIYSLICAWINGYVHVNKGEAGDLRRHCARYDVTVMMKAIIIMHTHFYMFLRGSKNCQQLFHYHHSCLMEFTSHHKTKISHFFHLSHFLG